jgi:hypothetical protein
MPEQELMPGLEAYMAQRGHTPEAPAEAPVVEQTEDQPATQPEAPAAEPVQAPEPDYLKHVSEQLGMEVQDWDDLKAKVQSAAYKSQNAAKLEEWEQQGRPLEDFFKVKALDAEALSKSNPDEVLFLAEKLKGTTLSDDDLRFKLNKHWAIDEEGDPDEVRLRKIEKQEAAIKAAHEIRQWQSVEQESPAERAAKAQAEAAQKQQQIILREQAESLEKAKQLTELKFGDYTHRMEWNVNGKPGKSVDNLLKMREDGGASFVQRFLTQNGGLNYEAAERAAFILDNLQAILDGYANNYHAKSLQNIRKEIGTPAVTTPMTPAPDGALTDAQKLQRMAFGMPV